MNGVGNGIAVAVEALEDDFDVIESSGAPPWRPHSCVV
jgi:hypothetical protein